MRRVLFPLTAARLFVCSPVSEEPAIFSTKMKQTRRRIGILLLLGLFLVFPATVFAQTEWTEWPKNPIEKGKGDDGIYYPSVLYDPDRFRGHGDRYPYKMWADKELQYYVSRDGIKWKFKGFTDTGLAGPVRHPVVEYYPEGFDGVNSGTNPSSARMSYRLWYWNESYLHQIQAIDYAESSDGISWHNNQPITQGEPKLVTGIVDDWNKGSYGPVDVLYNPDATNSGTDWTFTLYYDGTSTHDESLGVAFSEDGIHWIAYDRNGGEKADPVLEGSEGDTDWDGGSEGYVSRATILKIDGEYHMWYSGGQVTMQDGIGYAVSSDGLSWEKDPDNPVFHIGDGISWRDGRTYTPMVIYDPNGFCGDGENFLYKMWFSGLSSTGDSKTVGYATAGDPAAPCFDVTHAMIRFAPRNRDKLFVYKGVFGAATPGEGYAPWVTLSVDHDTLLQAQLSEFKKKGNTYVYTTPKREEPTVRLSLDFDRNLWKLKVDHADFSNIRPEVTFTLEIDEFLGSRTIMMQKRKNSLYYNKRAIRYDFSSEAEENDD